ncbi:hypothetical protein ACFSFY_03125 [Sporosarcina siberiensis]|uniref:Uncharacterized protein n=1 Tax=Sporosarcina siberiensis TaxID=1365606 RepID=A0ABW4SC49_9BACL
MNKRREATPKFLVVMSIIFGLFVTIQAFLVISSPHTFVRVVNLITTIFVSGVIGAFIREIFILKKK